MDKRKNCDKHKDVHIDLSDKKIFKDRWSRKMKYKQKQKQIEEERFDYDR